MKNTAIEWADHTFNPWRGCEKISPACANCYAEVWAKRTGRKIWGKKADREIGSPSYWLQPHRWDIEAKRHRARRRVFCSSLADVFEGRKDLDEQRARLWDLIETTSGLDWLLLTKRPENIRRMIPASWMKSPLPNVWYGTTVEDQQHADMRVPELLTVPAAMRFLSIEPLLGPVRLRESWLSPECTCGIPTLEGAGQHSPSCTIFASIGWLIVGGESGPKSRPLHPTWAQQLRDQAVAAQVPFFFKQWGEWAPRAELRPDVVNEFPGMEKDLGPAPEKPYWMTRMGKKRSGRVLDGRVWNEIPSLSR